MREIKFRAWSADRKEFRAFPNLLMSLGGALYWQLGFGLSFVDPTSFIIEQYTGLHDKNGVEIYEGDRIRVDGLTYVFDDIRTADSLREYCDKNKVEVVGNIHENPKP